MMKVGIINATIEAIEPIEKAFKEVAPQICLVHFTDTELWWMLKREGEISPGIARRLNRLLDSAQESDVDCIQLTCSAFNNLTSVLQPLYSAKIFRSDEAMLDEALSYQRVGLVATVAQTPGALEGYLRTRRPNIFIEKIVDTDAFTILREGNKEGHDERVRAMISDISPKVDVVVLSQYAIAHVATQVELPIPIITGPRLAAKRCLEHITKSS